MRTAVYVEDGVTQVVLTPENNLEKQILLWVHGCTKLEVRHGSFYHCQGGWIRQGTDETSVILIPLKDPPAKPVGEPT